MSKYFYPLVENPYDLDDVKVGIKVLKSRKLTTIPSYGPIPVSVPGCVDGWFSLHKKFGTKPMIEILAKMEISGIKLDKDFLIKLSKKFEKKIVELEKDIFKISKKKFKNSCRLRISSGSLVYASKANN